MGNSELILNSALYFRTHSILGLLYALELHAVELYALELHVLELHALELYALEDEVIVGRISQPHLTEQSF